MNRRLLLLPALLACFTLTFCSGSEPPAQESQEEAHKPSPTAAAELQEFDPDQVKARLDQGEDVFILDVRQPDELAEHGAIEGSVNIPIDDLENRLAEVPKDQPVVVHCMQGGRASRAAELLRQNGYADIQYGGIAAWKEKGYPVVYPEGAAKSTEQD